MKLGLKVYLILLLILIPLFGYYIGTFYLNFLIHNVLHIKVELSDIMTQFSDTIKFPITFLTIPVLTWFLYFVGKDKISEFLSLTIPLLLIISGFLVLYVRIIVLNYIISKYVLGLTNNPKIDAIAIHPHFYILIGIFSCFLCLLISFLIKIKERTNNTR
jgi:cytosine/uracil/thiamine/allantoin permease